jgi:hypothetical protein
MRKKTWVIIAAAVIGLSASCRDPSGNNPNDKPVNPVIPNNKTFIVFDNTQGICAASVYQDYRRRDEDKIAAIPAGRLSGEIEWTPGDSVPFYFSYAVNLKGISGFTLNYVPEIGKDQKAVRIDADITTTITIPKLDETVSSSDTLLSNNSYLLIQNNSSYSFQLHRGTGILSPDNSSAALVNSGERALYTINPGAASPYQLLVGADYKAFSGSIVSFEAGRVYSFVFDGNVSLIAEVEIKLENAAGVPQNTSGPDAPNAPVVIAEDGLLTLRWIAVQGAENYEVYISTAQQPPASPVKTVAGTTTVLTGLSNRTAYYIWVKAVNSSGTSNFSPRIRGIPWSDNEVPAVPGTPVIIPGINQLTVNWEECGGAASYEVYINTSTTRPPAPEITTEKTSAVIKNLENNVIYYLWVRAVNSTGQSDYSPFEAGTPKIPTTAPASPGRPILNAGSRELTVSWQPVENAVAYEIWLETSDNVAQAQKQGDDIEGDITEKNITGLENETVYYMWIRAKNIVGTSGFSPSANAKPSAFLVLPETPGLPTVIPGSRTLDVSWQLVEGALSYEVWTDLTNNPASAEKHGGDISGTSVTLTGLVNGTTYYIWVKAKNNIGVSEFSPQSNGTPTVFTAPPSAPQNAPTVTAGSGQFMVSWQQVEGAGAYEVWAGITNNPETATKRGNDVSSLSAVITGLVNNTTYYVWIKAKNSVGTSEFSPMASGTPLVYTIPPQTPAAVAVSIGDGQLSINWSAVEGATAYEVWLGTATNSASASKNGADISASLSTTIDSLNNGTTYYIWLKAKNSYGASEFSPITSGKPIANAITPTLSAGNGQLSVTWNAIVGADQYEVFCGTGINPSQTASQTVTVTSATISGLVNGTTYNVWIRGKNSTGTGAMSSPANAKPIGNMGAITLSAGNGQFSLSWTVVPGADQYEVYYSTSNSIPASPAQTASTTTATIGSLTNGTTYYVWVKGKNANGTSNVSTAVSGKPLGTPGIPTVSPAYKQLLVTWTPVAGADTYEVYYGIATPTTLAKTITGTTATIGGLTAGTTYYVRLRAKNTNGISDYGPSASNVPNTVVPTPGLYRGAEKIGNQNLADSLTYISSNAVSGDEYYIVLGADESVSPKTLSYSNKTVGITLLGYGSERTITLNANGNMFTVNSRVTLTLDENITLVGRKNSTSLVYISDGNLIMNDKAKITGNINTDSYGRGGGVNINGTFTMNGGTVSGNSTAGGSGGVYVGTNGIFVMHGGTISGNTTIYGGGGICIFGTASIYGGVISKNEAQNDRIGGGGILVYNGTLTMYGGTISGNTTHSSGGGVYVVGNTTLTIFTMHGGVISGNTAKEDGGGVAAPNFLFRKLPSSEVGQNSGIIYGSEAVGVDADGIPLKNTSGGSGQAVYSTQIRNTTVGETDHI